MNGLYEDIDEDLDEMDDEGFGEDDESLAEKRRRRGRRAGAGVRGRGYNQPRLEKSAVTQTQLHAAMARVGEDIRKLATSVAASESRLENAVVKTRKDQGNFSQMALLLPMLMRKTVLVSQLTPNTRLLSGEQDMMSMMLPMMMMGGMGGSSNGGGGQNDMMMMMMMMVMQPPPPASGGTVP